jgi:hypothetical protein
MNTRHRWWLGAALMCVTAICVQYARAESPPIVTAARALLGPLHLTRPLAPRTLELLLDEAEVMYRAGNLPQARAAYTTVIELDRLNVHAWLRLGNLNHQAGRETEAMEAYRHASLTFPGSPDDAEARGKALLNIAMLNLVQAGRAIDEVEAMTVASLDASRDAMEREMDGERQRIEAAATTLGGGTATSWIGRAAASAWEALSVQTPAPTSAPIRMSTPMPAVNPTQTGAIAAPPPRTPSPTPTRSQASLPAAAQAATPSAASAPAPSPAPAPAPAPAPTPRLTPASLRAPPATPTPPPPIPLAMPLTAPKALPTRVNTHSRSLPPALSALPPPTTTPALAPRPARPISTDASDTSSAAFEPYTVDRWIAKPRRPTAARAGGRSAVTEPITATPMPDPPKVEMFRGGSVAPVAR